MKVLKTYLEYIGFNEDGENHEDDVDVHQHQAKLPVTNTVLLKITKINFYSPSN